ncbi:MAG TPA: sigma 54-interacting transcriptional regulator [Candidatus Polarisedimenticolaceae bacterium]|nr:sigma 54-interacting transcriptional regulator [Candidatus Polarisedimenticolaceae bacterium]
MPAEALDDTAREAAASNAVLDALRTASAEPSPHEALSAVLEHARSALAVERAFLVEEAEEDAPPRVLALASVRAGAVRLSGTVARQLLSSGRAEIADSPSVRALELRAVLGAALPRHTWRRRGLILDSRSVTEPEGRLLEGFAAVLGLLARALPAFPPHPSDGWVGESPAYRALLHQIRAVAGSTLPVLIAGESGTGKEGVARRIHSGGARASRAFVAVNCAAVPEALLEGELFGSVRGAYTGAERDRGGLFGAADGGTLFLDEIGDMPLPMQAKLLRVLQEGRVRALGSAAERPVDVRIVAASHRDLRRACAEGTFRHDLLYRLAVLEVRVPALRERLADLGTLVPFLLDKLAADGGLPWCRPSPQALEVLRAHRWPGNIRELEGVLARAALRARRGVLEPEHLDLASPPSPPLELHACSGESFECTMIRAALAASSGSMTLAAARIGWTRQKLRRRMLALGLRAPG